MRNTIISTLALVAFAGAAQAQITSGNSPSVYTASSITYSQNFNGLASNGTNNTWTQNSTVLGWRSFYANSGSGTVGARDNAGSGSTPYVADNGGIANQASLFSYGTSGTTERALGAVPFSSATGPSGQRRGDYYVWVAIRNDTDAVDGFGSILNQATISYRGEQWRNSGSVADTIRVDYKIYPGGALTSTDPSNGATSTGWTAASALNFSAPQVGGTPTALDGNAAANSATLSVTLNNLGWAPGDANNFGQTLVVRFWFDSRNSFVNPAQGLAIDDFGLTAIVPAPGAAGLLGLGGLLVARRRRA
jgi:hypothetical protein